MPLGQRGESSKNAVFRGKRHDNKFLKVQILLSRNFVVMAQAPTQILTLNAFRYSGKISAIFLGLSQIFLGNPRTDTGNSHSLLESFLWPFWCVAWAACPNGNPQNLRLLLLKTRNRVLRLGTGNRHNKTAIHRTNLCCSVRWLRGSPTTTFTRHSNESHWDFS